jgi:DNA polymerase-4
LDVTENKKNIASATIIAKEIQGRIFSEIGLTVSAGVSYNKFLAKIASDINKPNGIAVIKPSDAEKFLEALPIGKFYGVGKVSAKRMMSLGIHTGLDLKRMDLETLIKNFGKTGKFYYDIVRGIDTREVSPYRERKSYGREITLSEDILDMDLIKSILNRIAVELESSMKRKNIKGRTITLKVKYHDFQQITRSKTLDRRICSADEMINEVYQLLEYTDAGRKKIRLLGISVSHLDEDNKAADEQLVFDY